MERRSFETPLGEVWLWGRWGPKRPLVLVIHGAFATKRPGLTDLQRYIPDAELVWAHQPGNHCPGLTEIGVATTAAAYSAVLMGHFRNRPTLVIGASIGALVALSMRAPNIRRLLLLEPPLLTDDLGALTAMISPLLAGRDDYRELLECLTVPTTVLAGDREQGDGLPTFVRGAERALFRNHPMIDFREVPGAGHNVIGDKPRAVLEAAQEALRALRREDEPDQDAAIGSGNNPGPGPIAASRR